MSSFGLYIHVPYCNTICPYCDFNVVRNKGKNTRQWADFFSALTNEWRSRKPMMSGPVRTLYFGGGTPSLAPPALIGQFIVEVKESIGFERGIEITLEADPKTVSASDLVLFKKAGVTRLSLGWQTNDDKLLKVIGRQHQSKDNIAIFEQARAAGFDNISVDFMFGLPGQTMEMIECQLEEVVQRGPEHISLYALTYHEGTPFDAWRKSGKLIAVAEDTEAAMMSRIECFLENAGYEHYEVSNYAKPGFRSKHNSAYWQGIPYLGIGPGANSFLRKDWESATRFESIRQPNSYITYWNSNQSSADLVAGSQWHEELTARQLLQERFMLGLRTCDGISLDCLEGRFIEDVVKPAMDKALTEKWVVLEGSVIRPTSLGMQFADSLGALFF